MKSMITSVALVAMLVMALGCSKRVMVAVPPSMDLQVFEAIGMVEFTSNSEGNLDQFASQKFLEAVQASQPGVRVIELGDHEVLLESVGHDQMNYEAIKAIGDKYELDAIIVGKMEVTDVKPRVSLQNIVTSLSASADVDAALTARLYETGRGATLWTSSAKQTATVASVGLSSARHVRFDATDPENAYGELVNGLVYTLTDDFRVHYVRQ
jgi:hypothetical protein